MFYGEPTLKDYREMDITKIIREHLLTKGTKGRLVCKNGTELIGINRFVNPKDLVRSGLFVYGLKDNPTNRSQTSRSLKTFGKNATERTMSSLMVTTEKFNK